MRLELPEGFAEKHSKETTDVDDASAFSSKSEYVDLYKKTRQNSVNVLESLSGRGLPGREPGALSISLSRYARSGHVNRHPSDDARRPIRTRFAGH